ncbi:Flp pilus assembly complex ATPase component TadA [Patescibacteria group bacterium]|nr:Flp pilus assembly complex ATPase component TadA [Patescibacteria group bacterium]
MLSSPFLLLPSPHFMTQEEVYQAIAKAAELSGSQAAQLVQAVFQNIAREISVGEAVDIEGLGKFYTVKYPARSVEDPPGSGHTKITLPTIEPEFDPDDQLVSFVADQIKKRPELFANDPDDDEESEEEKPETEKELPDLPDLPDDEEASSSEEKEEKQEEKQEEKEENKKEDKPLGRASTIEFVDISRVKVEKDILSLVPQHIAKQYNVVPIDLAEGVLTVAMVDPEDFDALEIVRKETGLSIKPVLTTRDDLSAVLDQYTGLQAELQEVIDHSNLGISKQELEAASQEDIQDQTNKNAPTAKIVFSLLKRAVKEHASDVHIEPYEGKVMVRFRIDGILQSRVELPKEIQSAVISRLKILANLKIDEQRLPQDGRFNLIIDHRQVDFRLSTIPVVFGEKVVMRILDKSVGIISLENVGLSDHGLQVLTKNMERSHGMILVTGPTGSGKTTSLYAVLGKLMKDTVNILTLEDPVEYRIESINQSQVHTEIGYTFATGLRAVVRQDPDIVMLGEIRDQETADMAIHAALTGHVVLSTLHTNDAAGAFPRLIDMNIEPFLITTSIHTVIAQRLARIVCPDCKMKVEPTKPEIEEVEAELKKMPAKTREEFAGKKLQFYEGKGCDACGGKGYRGRLGVFEVLDVSEPIRELILKRSSGDTITMQAIKEGMVTMVQDGIIKALRGQTSLSEVWRVTKE